METPSPNTADKALRPSDLGPLIHANGVTYRVWALGRNSVMVQIENPGAPRREYALEQRGNTGYFSGTDPMGKPGDLYKFSIDGGSPIPDFVSRYQPQGVLGPSMVIDAATYDWQTKDWQRPSWNGQVIYECHLGTFTPEGTFRSAIEKLDHLVSLGVTALELMPVAEWAGERGWGYDGVMLFAPYHAYGSPDDFRALIDACHARGLVVILDVVFNHLGPEGNFSHHYSDFYFHRNRNNAWGQNFDLDGPNSGPVRAMLLQNIRYWLEEFSIDGFRMDATHAVHDDSELHLLAEAAAVVHEHAGFIVAEDERNSRLILELAENQGWNFDGVWADDFHHTMRVSQTREHQSYYGMFQGTTEEIARTLRQGWLYTGQVVPSHGKARGTPCDDFPPEKFVYCISNHDQAGNRLVGERLHHSISPAAYRAYSLFLCLIPCTPLLFMGQEWGTNSPFLYFVDMPDELATNIAKGRKRELIETKFAADQADLEKMPNPQDPKTFLRSKLEWSEIQKSEHGNILKLYRAGLKLRNELFGRKNPPRNFWEVVAQSDTVTIHYRLDEKHIMLSLHLSPPTEALPEHAKVLLRSNAPEFSATAGMDGPETIVALL